VSFASTNHHHRRDTREADRGDQQDQVKNHQHSPPRGLCGARQTSPMSSRIDSARDSARQFISNAHVPTPSEYLLKGLRQQSLSLTFGVFIGAALTSGAVCGAVAFYLANENVLRRLRANASTLVFAARDAVLQTTEGQVLERAVRNIADPQRLAHRVEQNILEAPHGNALQACTASILGLPLGTVPNFVASPDYWNTMLDHASANGLSVIKIDLTNGVLPHPSAPGTLCIARGNSPRGSHAHVVVARVAADGKHLELAHDPFPGGCGLQGEPSWAAFYAVKADLHEP